MVYREGGPGRWHLPGWSLGAGQGKAGERVFQDKVTKVRMPAVCGESKSPGLCVERNGTWRCAGTPEAHLLYLMAN